MYSILEIQLIALKIVCKYLQKSISWFLFVSFNNEIMNTMINSMNLNEYFWISDDSY